MTTAKRKPRYTVPELQKEVADKFAAMIEKDGLRAFQRFAVPNPPQNGVTGHIYTRSNVLTTSLDMMIRGTDDPRYIPRSQLMGKSPVGKIRKGEQGIPIVFFRPPAPNDNTADNPKRFPFSTIRYCWHVSQLDDVRHERLKPMSNMPSHQSAAVRRRNVEDFVAGCGSTIKTGAAAFYAIREDTITMPPIDAFYAPPGMDRADVYYCTLLHEHIHWTGAEKRLDRKIRNRFGTKDYAFEELVAEIGAVMACVQLGIQSEPREDNAAYVKSWISRLREEPNSLFEAAKLAGRALEHLNSLQPQQQEEAA